MELIEQYTSTFNNQPLGEPEWLSILRKAGIDDFQLQGFPPRKSERYRYMQPETLFANDYKNLDLPKNIELDIQEIFKCDIPQLGAHVVLLVNGFYFEQNQIHGQLPDGTWVGSLKQAISEKAELVQQHLGKIATFDDNIIALNTAMFRDGIVVHVAKNNQLQKPLQIINLLISDEPLLVQFRNLVVLEPNSKANIVICSHTLSDHKFVSNSVTEVFVGEGAHFDQTSMQNEHNDSFSISSTFINQERNSKTDINTITLHGGLVRNNLSIKLNGQGAETLATGLFFTDKTQHVDNHVFIHHAKPNCSSSQIFKGILDDTSTGAFSGRILVARDAQKTQAFQKNNNLLLTAEAKMNTRPQLEIYADDVKCSHGATVGQLDQDALFYMRARGIGLKEARLLLMSAFAHEIIAKISVEPLRDRIDELVKKRLRGELSRCHNCEYRVF